MATATSPQAENAIVAFVGALSGIWLPAALVIAVWLLISKADTIALAFKSAPLVRRLKIYGVEIEIDPKALEDLEERQNEIFQKLSKKIEKVATKTSKSLSIFDHLRDASREIINLRKTQGLQSSDRNVRFTIHVKDSIFENHVYQLVDYYLPLNDSIAVGKGRRFSVRYGIIGLCWRTRKSHATASAFVGSATAINDLKEKWSMTDAEADSAKSKPSCLAIALNGDNPSTQLGIIYADAVIPNFWGSDDPTSDNFAAQCEHLEAVKNLRKALIEYEALMNQIRIDLDLTSL